MSSKADSFYFNNFVEASSIACEAADMLKDVLSSFNPESLSERLKELHEVEHKGDRKRHEITAVLVRAFITPLEREDILKLSQSLDDVIDSIEDIVIHLYINNVQTLRQDSLQFADVVISCCRSMKKVMEEFHNFKRSKSLQQLTVDLNHLEELGDELYIKSIRTLHSTCTDPMEVMAWHEIYGYFEKCCDACETVADIVESITIGNK